MELGKSIDRIALKSKFSNFLKILIGVLKVSEYTKFHPGIVNKIVNFSRTAIDKEKEKIGMINLINMLQVSESIKVRY
jgi:hypothetical protein